MNLSHIKTLLLFITLSTLKCCNIEKTESIISQWELNQNACTIDEFLFISKPTPYKASDSLIVLKKTFTIKNKQILKKLQNQLIFEEEKYSKSQAELLTINNSNMYKLYSRQIEEIKLRIDRIKLIVDVYTKTPEKTQLKALNILQKKYMRDTNQILGKKINVNFNGKIGFLPQKKFTKTYLLDKNNTKVISEIN